MNAELDAEVRSVLGDLSWLDRCTCADFPIESYFVRAGRTIPPAALRAARLCPARRQEVIWAYGRDLRSGYFGGLSGGQRAAMTLEEALDFIAKDTKVARREYRPKRRQRTRSPGPAAAGVAR